MVPISFTESKLHLFTKQLQVFFNVTTGKANTNDEKFNLYMDSTISELLHFGYTQNREVGSRIIIV